MSAQELDVVIIGAGISGINCAYRLQQGAPHLRYRILEARAELGGTWDLFKFPGVRSDSDLASLSFAWYPWPHKTVFADAELILDYVNEAVSRYHIDQHIQYQQKVLSANWSSKTRKWELVVEQQAIRIRARFIVLGTGYYDYETPLQTVIPGLDQFKGDVIHPQFWPTRYSYTGKNVAVIGSGATAITLLPRLAPDAAERSPSYIAQKANSTPLSPWLRKLLPLPWVLIWERFFHISFSYLVVLFCRTFPNAAAWVLKKEMAYSLPKRINPKPHFEPRYTPWTQRICLAPDSDFFKTLSRENVNVVTGEIGTVVASGILMKDSDSTFVKADTIITATGLNMKFGGGIDLRVDGQAISWGQRLIWNGAMLDGVPNMVWMMGYTDGAWTLGADATARILLRLIAYMQQEQAASATPRAPEDAKVETSRVWPLDSTYRRKVDERLPVYGVKGPWAPRRVSPFADYLHSRWGNVTDGLDFRP
ncbi:hypothetical protein KVR01_011410 [Diaporthe batatas]|uniref:uncharacterized protein n=1 Tax=Diaporthe batatas TaxID=748121 RepID=UPI001D03B182|nr:uncharacterized protein KVR01_011410 [Diaporthe batatas]KAG8158967.1 hypothetical protein KVR01_011410 [Diaporthe batatas]